VGADEDVGSQAVAPRPHAGQRCGDGERDDGPVGVRHQAETMRPGADAAQPADDAERGRRAAGAMASRARNDGPNDVGATGRSCQRNDIDLGTEGAQPRGGRLAGDIRATQEIDGGGDEGEHGTF
jgi:hypothetical protein